MRSKNFFFVALSALSFALALFAPAYFFWLTFFFLIPIFYGARTENSNYSFTTGFLWGFIFFSVHLVPVTILIVNDCFGWFRFIFPVILICYSALHTGIWFTLAFRKKSFLRFVFYTWLFFWWVPRGLLWASGAYIGYPLMYPLLPLAEYPQFLAAVRFFGTEFLLLFLICFSMSSAFFLRTKNKKTFFLPIIFLTPFLIGFVLPHKEKELPDFFKTFAHVAPPDIPDGTPALDVAQEIYYRIRRLLKQHPEVRYIVMPELSCRFALNERQDVIDLWTHNALGDQVGLLIGACKKKDENIFNSFYFIQQGRVQQVHDKTCLMPFAEYVSKIYRIFSFTKKLFLNGAICFTPGTKNVHFWFKEGHSCKNYICAEALFAKKKYSNLLSDNDFLLSIFNDALFSNSFHHLFVLWVKLQGLKQNKVALFVGRKFACLFTPGGKEQSIYF